MDVRVLAGVGGWKRELLGLRELELEVLLSFGDGLSVVCDKNNGGRIYRSREHVSLPLRRLENVQKGSDGRNATPN